MPRSPSTAPRKAPTQARSQATVDALIGAMTRVLMKEGYESASTNRVAQAAGVSVGSLYQYFPSKEALVLAVMERHALEMTTRFEALLPELIGADVEEAAARVVHMFLEYHQLNPQLHRVLIEQVPRVGALNKLNELNRRYEQLVSLYLEAHRDELGLRDTSIASWLLVTTVESLCHNAVLYRSDLMATPRLEEHIVRVVLSYLRSMGAPAPRRRGRPSARESRA